MCQNSEIFRILTLFSDLQNSICTVSTSTGHEKCRCVCIVMHSYWRKKPRHFAWPVRVFGICQMQNNSIIPRYPGFCHFSRIFEIPLVVASQTMRRTVLFATYALSQRSAQLRNEKVETLCLPFYLGYLKVEFRKSWDSQNSGTFFGFAKFQI